MNKSLKNFAIRTLVATTVTLAAMGSANAAVFFYRTGVVVAPVVVAPVVVAPVAPVVVAPVYVPTCRLISVPFVNAFTGVTYLATRRVCN